MQHYDQAVVCTKLNPKSNLVKQMLIKLNDLVALFVKPGLLSRPFQKLNDLHCGCQTMPQTMPGPLLFFFSWKAQRLHIPLKCGMQQYASHCIR